MEYRTCASCGCKISKGQKYCEICWASEVYKYNKAVEQYERDLREYNNLPPGQKAIVDGEAQKIFNKGLTVLFFIFLLSMDIILFSLYGIQVYSCILLLLIIATCIYSTIKLYNVFGKITQLLFSILVGVALSYNLIGGAVFKLVLKISISEVNAMSLSEKFKNWQVGVIYVLSIIIGIICGAWFGLKIKVSGRPKPPKKPSNSYI